MPQYDLSWSGNQQPGSGYRGPDESIYPGPYPYPDAYYMNSIAGRHGVELAVVARPVKNPQKLVPGQKINCPD